MTIIILCSLALFPLPVHSEKALWDPNNSEKFAPGNLDAYSTGCLGCHDLDTGYRLSGFNSQSVSLSESNGFQLSSHPIGARYADVANGNSSTARHYRSLTELDSVFILPDGRVSCVTCHEDNDINTYPAKHGALVMSNRGSRLCLGCHDY